MKTRRQTIHTLLAAAGVAILAPATAARAQTPAGADLNVSPKRVVFGPDLRSATVYVFNQGDAPATYSIGLVDRVMTPDGQIRAVNDAAAQNEATDAIAKVRSAQELITFTPRRVTLGPGQSQVIRLRVNRPADLAAGEYRSHLTVTALPPEDAGLTADQAAVADAATAVITRINTLFSISIAVVVRKGAAEVQGGIDKVAYGLAPSTDPKAPGGQRAYLSLDLTRRGRSSLYGDLEVRMARAPRNSPPIGAIRGVGVYGEIDRRSVQIPLSETPRPGDRLEITFRDDDIKPGATLATATFITP